MSDFSTDFDPRSVGWWQRRSVIRRLKHTEWLTGADRDLRVQRARAAQSRGELNALTRDLVYGGSVPTSQVAPAPGNQAYGQAPQPPAAMPPALQAPAAPRKRSLRSSLLIGGLVLLVGCGGGLVSCVSAVVDSVSDATSVTSTDDLLSAVGWSQMIADLDDSIDIRASVEAVVRPGAATIALPNSADRISRYYYDGDITTTAGANRDPARAEFDLAAVEGEMVVSAVAMARERAVISDSIEAWVLVSATEQDTPTLMVTFPDDPGSYSLVVDLDGTIVSENKVS